jgi:hypothetical protein
MKPLIEAIFALGVAFTAISAFAQDAAAQEIVVTGSRVQADGYDASMPIITLRRTADFAVQQVKVTSDSRDASVRQDEIYAMIRNAIGLAGKFGVELGSGEYIVEPVNLGNYSNLILAKDDRPDTSQTIFLVKTRLSPGMDAKTALDRITRFIAAVPAVGRAEMKTEDELTLSVVNPDQYRPQIVELVATDAATVAAKFGAGYGVEVKGLDRPVLWSRASLTEVFLYLPSAYVVRPKN